MPIQPDQLSTGPLRRRWRGYDRAQVESLLARARTDYAGAIDRIAALAEQREQYRTGQEELQGGLAEITDSARAAAAQARREAEAEADAILARADRAAQLIINQAEESAAACARQTHALRASAEQEFDTARRRLAEADRHARHLEDAARLRWDTLRADTEKRFQHLQLAEQRFAERIRHVEEVLAALRTEGLPAPTPAVNGNHRRQGLSSPDQLVPTEGRPNPDLPEDTRA